MTLFHCAYRKFPTDLSALLLGDLYYTRLSLSGVSEHLSHNALLELHQMLHANLSSNIPKVRLQSQQRGLEELKVPLPASCRRISEDRREHVDVSITAEFFSSPDSPADSADSLSL